jgi:hypothetical protein
MTEVETFFIIILFFSQIHFSLFCFSAGNQFDGFWLGNFWGFGIYLDLQLEWVLLTTYFAEIST